VWRSHDIYGAWFPNVVGLTYLTQYVAKQLDNINIGSIVVHSISAHVYMNDYNNALRISRKNKRFGVI
jgi:thymidylate synthase